MAVAFGAELAGETPQSSAAGAESTPNWPSFRGHGATGVAESARPPIAWNTETGNNIRWTTTIAGHSHSSPVIWGDVIYVVTSMSEDPSSDGRRRGVRNNAIDDLAEREWKILALHRDDGRVLWERTAHRGVPRVRRHEKGSHANSTPATDGRYVVAVFNSEGLFCWSMDGELAWSKDIGRLDPGYWGQPDNNWGHATSPILFEDLVIIQSDDFADSFLAAFRLSDGSESWRAPRDELATWATPVIHGEGEDAVLIAQGGNHVRAYDARTGAELWHFADHAEVKVPSPFVVGELLVFTGGAPAGRPLKEPRRTHRQRFAVARRLGFTLGGPHQYLVDVVREHVGESHQVSDPDLELGRDAVFLDEELGDRRRVHRKCQDEGVGTHQGRQRQDGEQGQRENRALHDRLILSNWSLLLSGTQEIYFEICS
jgi:hypothetical protein